MPRKTIKVEQIKDLVNQSLANSVDGNYITPQWRFGLCFMLEQILHDTDNYKGYWALRENEVPLGQKPGIIFDESSDQNHQYPDDSRRRYY